MLKKNLTTIVLLILIIISCSKKDDPLPANPPENSQKAAITVDCSEPHGKVMRIEQANVHSTTSLLPDKAIDCNS